MLLQNKRVVVAGGKVLLPKHVVVEGEGWGK